MKRGGDGARVGLRLVTSFCILHFAFCIPAFAQNAAPGGYVDPQAPGVVSTSTPPQLKGVGFKQRLDETLPLDAMFKDDN